MIVHICTGNAEANLLRSVLANAGIRCLVQGENHRSLLGPIGPYIELRLLVAERDAELARRIVMQTQGPVDAAEDEPETDEVPSERPEHSSPRWQPSGAWLLAVAAVAVVLFAVVGAMVDKQKPRAKDRPPSEMERILRAASSRW